MQTRTPNDSVQPNREELLKMAISTAKQGNKEGARVIFRRVLSDDNRNERAMIWMAKLANNEAERQQWLDRVLKVNPDNEVAQKALDKLTYQKQAEQNRVLLIFGAVVVALVLLSIVILAVIFLL